MTKVKKSPKKRLVMNWNCENDCGRILEEQWRMEAKVARALAHIVENNMCTKEAADILKFWTEFLTGMKYKKYISLGIVRSDIK